MEFCSIVYRPHEFLRLLKERNFTDGPDATEPRGIQKKVLEAVNNQYYGRTKLKTNRTTVCEWVRRVRENNYQVTNCEQDYTQSSQNRRKFFDNEQQRIRDFIREEKLKSNEIGSVYSDKKKKQITVRHIEIIPYDRPGSSQDGIGTARFRIAAAGCR